MFGKAHIVGFEPTKDTAKLHIQCPFCGKIQDLEVNKHQLFDWQHGKLVQVAFPDLTKDQRELLISGVCTTCWDATFKDE